MFVEILRCITVLFLVFDSGASAKLARRSLIYNTYASTIIHDTFPTDGPPTTGGVPTFDPTPTSVSPTTPTTTPPYNTPTTTPPVSPTPPTTTPPSTGGDGGIGGSPPGGGIGEGPPGGIGGGPPGGIGGGGPPGGGIGESPPGGIGEVPGSAPGGGTGGGGIGGGGGAPGGGAGGGGTGGGAGGGAWCVANPSASEKALQVGLDYACGYGGTDCSAIQPGGSCANPNTVKDHASYAYNDYYQKNPSSTSCDFGGTAQLVHTDPSTGSCHYTPPNGSGSPHKLLH
ncbi:Glucan endo-1 3-beta-glucosidase 1 [Bienertia sinuspersici]